nr:MAG TPA: hypothetical protein [Caudoviricetes sp.]
MKQLLHVIFIFVLVFIGRSYCSSLGALRPIGL